MKKTILLIFTLLIFMMNAYNANAQSAGDYRSVDNGSWTTLSVWEKYNGSAWAAADHSPSYTDGKITIRATDTISLPSGTFTIDQMEVAASGKLTMLTGSTLSVRNGFGDDLTINGALEIQSGATLFRGAITPVTVLNGELNSFGKIDAPIVTGTASKCTLQANSTLADSLTNNNLLYLAGGVINFDSALCVNNDSVRISGAQQDTLTLQKTGIYASIFANNGKIINDSTDVSFTQNVIVMNYITFTNAGTINISKGGSGRRFSESEIHNYNSFTNSGTLACYEVNTGDLKVFNESGGSMIMNSGTSFTFNNYSSPNDFEVLTNRGALSFNFATSMPLHTKIDLLQGNIGGTGSLTINGTLHQEGGSFSLPLTIASGSFYEVVSGDATYNSSVTNGGLLSWQTNGKMILNNATVTNNSTFNQFQGSEILLQSGSGGFVNNGVYNLQFIPPAVLTLNAPFTNNTGSKFKMQGNGVINNSTFTNYVTLNLGTGNTAYLQNNSTGILNIEAGSAVSDTGSIINSGACNFNTNFTIPLGLTLTSSGTVDGTGALTLDGVINQTGGTINNTILIDFGAVFNINAASTATINKNVTNNGTVNWINGNVTLASGVAFTNNTVMNVSGNNTLSGSSASFLNKSAGKFEKNTGTGATVLAIPFTDSGSFNIYSGSINIQSTFLHTGLIDLGAAGIISNTGTITLSGAGKFKGTGTLNNSAGLIVNNNQRFPKGLVINNTKTAISGTGTIKISGALNMIAGSLAVPATIKGSCQLDSSVTITASFDNNGTTTWNSGNIVLTNVAINNVKNFNINGNDFDKMNGTGAAAFNNSGTMTKALNTVTIINVPITNNSTGVIAGVGQFQINGTLTNNGGVSPGVKKIGILSFNKNPITASSSVNIDIKDLSNSGADQLSVDGSISLSGTLNLSAAGGNVPPGNYEVIVCTNALTGSFTAVNKPSNWVVQYTLNAVRVVVPPLPLVALSGTNNNVSAGTGISKFIVYPNPVHDVLNVQLPAAITKATLVITDISGKTIQEISNISNGMQHINVAGLAKGVYMFAVKTAGNTYSEKFVKE